MPLNPRSTRFHSPFLAVFFALCGGLLAFAAPNSSPDLSFLSKPPSDWTEAQALQVLNESPWAHAVATSVQDTPCTYQNAAFPGLLEESRAWRDT